MAGMLTRLAVAFVMLLCFGVLTAWAWDRSESEVAKTQQEHLSNQQSSSVLHNKQINY